MGPSSVYNSFVSCVWDVVFVLERGTATTTAHVPPLGQIVEFGCIGFAAATAATVVVVVAEAAASSANGSLPLASS